MPGHPVNPVGSWQHFHAGVVVVCARGVYSEARSLAVRLHKDIPGYCLQSETRPVTCQCGVMDYYQSQDLIPLCGSAQRTR